MDILEEIKEQTEQTIKDRCLLFLYRVLGIIAVPLSFTCLCFICDVAAKNLNVFNSGLTKTLVCIAIVICFKFIISKWERFRSFVQSNLLVFILLTIYVLFYRFWEDLIDNHIVNNFMAAFEPNLINDLVFALAVVFCIILCYFNRGKNVTQRTKLLSIIVILFWAYYRCFSDRFCFISLFSFNNIKYLDILPIYCLSKLIPLILKEYEVGFYPNKNSLISDAPIESLNADKLERKEFAKKVVESLYGIYPYSGAFTYGIDASWGVGKTSFMNLMKNQIRQVPIKSIIIDFNPWLFSTNKDIVSIFFDELSKALKQYDYTLAKNIIDYSKLLTAFGTKESRVVAELLELNQHDSSLLEKKNQITYAIKRVERRIFVFIDDIDRLDADELLEMMKLIRNSSNFPYMYFVVAYDKLYLVRCLEKKMDIKGSDFVEKIIQHEFHLPPCPSEKLRQLLYDYIESAVGLFYSHDKQELIDFILNDDSNSNPLTGLFNIREVKRLANHFLTSYSYVKGKINVIDLLLFELFKTKYPLVYSFFERKKDEILELDMNNHYVLFEGTDTINEDNRHINILNYIKNHNTELNISDIEQRSIQTIIEFLFKQVNLPDIESKHSRRLNDKDWFDKYINLTESETDISDKEFEEVMKRDDASFKDALVKWLQIKKAYSLRYHIKNYRAIDKEEQKKLIQSMFYYITHYKDIDNHEKDSLLSGLREFNDDDNLLETDRQFIMDVIKENGNNFNTLRYVGYLHRHRFDYLSDNDLITVQQYLFNEAIERHEDDPLIVLASFRMLLGYDYNEIRNKRFTDEYSNTLLKSMKNYSEKHIIGVLTHIIDEEADDNSDPKYYYIYEYARIIWGTWDGFYCFILNIDCPNKPEIIEIQAFLMEFKSNHYKKTRFIFNHFWPIGMDLDTE